MPTQRDLLAGIVAKHYAKQHILPRDVVLAHERGEIHYHDLDYSHFFPMFNCMLIDLKGMLTNGFKMGNAEIDEIHHRYRSDRANHRAGGQPEYLWRHHH
ncbi:anaerobic ribonucleoside-triphosphate reductase [Serratia proteamaculans]